MNLVDFKKYIPEQGIPLVIAEDGKENCGYNTRSRHLILYHLPSDRYLSIQPIGKRSELIRIPSENIRVWVVDLQHYLFSVLKGSFDISYYLHPKNKNVQWFLDQYPIDQHQSLKDQFYTFIAQANTLNPLNYAKDLFMSLAKTFDRNEREITFLLHTFRTYLVAEKILRNDRFPNPNLYALKQDHKHDAIITAILTADSGNTLLQPYEIIQCKETFEKWDYELKHIASIRNIHDFTYNEVLNYGNHLFLNLLNPINPNELKTNGKSC